MNVLLRCEGLDTLATVFVNDVEAGTAGNFHRVWEYDIKEVLKVGI
jgi:beta-mannosidase